MTELLREVVLRKLRLPLVRPYRLSYHTFTEFEPIIVQVRSSSGREGWGEGHISLGSSSETREGGWRFCREYADKLAGLPARAVDGHTRQPRYRRVAARAATRSARQCRTHGPLAAPLRRQPLVS